MRYELTDGEWAAIKPMNKPRGAPLVNDRRVLNGIFWVLRSGAPWRELCKPAAANATILPSPGQVRLMLGNEQDEAAVITINEQAIALAAHAGRHLPDGGVERKLLDNPEIDLPPGKYKVTFKVASGAAQSREFEVAADETWGLLVGPNGAPLAVQIY
jgi:hypothetical protein